MENLNSTFAAAELPESYHLVFQRNLSAFEKYQPNVFSSLNELNNSSSTPSLFYTQSGLLNVIPAGLVKPLYSDDPYKDCLTQIVRFTKVPEFTSFNFQKIKRQDDTRLHVQFMNKLIDIHREALTQSEVRLTAVPDKYPSAVIFGVGLGYHLDVLFKLHQFQHCFICEPDLDLFYLSAHVIPWSDILEQAAKNKVHLHFQLGLNPDEYIAELYRLTEYFGPHILVSSMLYQHYASEQLNSIISVFYSRLHEIQRNFSFYNDAINGLAHMNQHLANAVPIMADAKAPLITDCPVYVIGNGPSLDDAIDFLKKNQQNAVIIAAGTALATLLKVGIKPDFHVLVERTKATYDFLVRTLPIDAYKEINLLTVDVMHADVPPLYKWTGLSLKGPEASSALTWLIAKQHSFEPKVLNYSGPLVSNTALSYAIELGFKNIYLFGVDNGSLGDKSHSVNSVYYDEKFKFGNSVLKNNTYQLEGNFGTTIFANSLLARSKINMDMLLSENKDRNFYHVGVGAKLNHAVPIFIPDIAVSICGDKYNLIKNLKEILFKILPEKSFEEHISFNGFQALCDELINISSSRISKRDEIILLLERQQEVINRLHDVEHLYFYRVIVGSFNYFSCLFLTTCYGLEDEEKSLIAAHKAIKLWSEFLYNIKFDFPHSWYIKCKLGLRG